MERHWQNTMASSAGAKAFNFDNISKEENLGVGRQKPETHARPERGRTRD